MRQRTGQPFRIRVELTRQRSCPQGSPTQGYELVLPLDANGRIDALSWLDSPQACSVRQFRLGAPERHGKLARSSHGRWYFDFGSEHDADLYQGLIADRFVLGQFIGVVESDSELRTYRITSMQPLTDMPAATGALP